MSQRPWQAAINHRAGLIAAAYSLTGGGLWLWSADQARKGAGGLVEGILGWQTCFLFVPLTALVLFFLVRKGLIAGCRSQEAREAMAELGEQYRAAILSAPLPIFSLDRSGRVLLWNTAAEQIFGWSATEVMGQLLPCVPAAEWERFTGNLHQTLLGWPQVGLPVRWPRRDGFCLDLYLSLSPIGVDGGKANGVLVMAQEVAGHQILAEGRAVLGTVNGMLLEGLPVNAALQAAAEQMARLLHCEAAWIGAWSEDGRLQPLAQIGGPAALLTAVINQCRAPGPCRCGACRASESGEPVQLRCGTTENREEAEAFCQHQIHAAVLLPLAVQGRSVGVVAFYSRTADLSAPVTLQTLHLFADQAASALQISTQLEQIQLQTAALESAAFAVLITNRIGVIEWVNPFFTTLTGYTPAEVIGQTPRLLNSGLMPRSTFTELWRTILAGSSWRGELQNRRKNGSIYTEEQTITPVRGLSGEITHFVAVKQDMTDRNRYLDQLRFLTTHDVLTGLANRQLLSVRLDELARAGGRAALVALDVDQLQLVNDAEGYERGDQLLQAIATLLQSLAPPGSTVARLSGDGFAALMPDRQPSDGQALVQRLNESLAEGPGLWGGGGESVSLSAGIVPVTEEIDPKEALLLAQLVLREVRPSGHGQVRKLEAPADLDQYRVAARWGIRVAEAVRTGSLGLHYQPVVDLEKGQVIHAEALIRLVNEDGSLEPAGSFLQVAEEFRFMPEIDRWVLSRVLEELEQHPNLHLFMNLSGQSLGNLAQLNWIAARVRAAGSAAGRLTLEITETVAVSNMVQLQSWMEELTALGCRFALDDLGQGFSSLSYLTNLPLSYVKIDGSFVSDLMNNEKNQLVVEALTRIARSMGLQVVAEWVEDEAAVGILQAIGVHMGQGFFLGRPGPLHELLDRYAVSTK